VVETVLEKQRTLLGTEPTGEHGDRGVRPSAGVKEASRIVPSLLHDHPGELPEERVDVRSPPFPCSAIHFNQDSLSPSFAASSVKNHFNVSVTGKTVLHRLVHQRVTTRNDE
jgi:hypothetical protein